MGVWGNCRASRLGNLDLLPLLQYFKSFQELACYIYVESYSQFMPLYHCDHCNEDKPLNYVYPYAKRKCKACFKAYRQRWERAFPEKLAAKRKRMWAKHRDKYLARNRAKPRKKTVVSEASKLK